MGYQGNRRFGPIIDEYGPVVGGHRYKRFRREPLSVVILKTITKRSALLSSLQSLIEEIRIQNKSSVDVKQIKRRIHYLKRRKFIAFPGKGRFTVTLEGRKRLDKYKLDNLRIIKPKAWDGKWRILVFDIIEEKAHLRDYFRKRLKQIGFYHFQRSVFLFPYPCDKEIDEMSEDLGIENGVHLITANRFAGDDSLVEHFDV